MSDHQPSINQTAFCCPHCGAYTTQDWYKLTANKLENDNPIPIFPRLSARQEIIDDSKIDPKTKEYYLEWYDKSFSRLVKEMEDISGGYYRNNIINLHLSKCYNCHEYSVWVHDMLVFPNYRIAILPNEDLPEEIKYDFIEAQKIVELSPRGAAALLRLCIQKLCKHLGEKGKNIDDDINSLVKKGLNPLVQKSLDIVRVIGNNSVHPGYIDIDDDKQTTITLFNIVNTIVDQMISHPKIIDKLYYSLPEDKRKAIEKRDEK